MFTKLVSRPVLLASAFMLFPFLMTGVFAAHVPSAPMAIYLPLVAKSAPLPEGLKIVGTVSKWHGNYEYEFVNGVVENVSTTPLYSVALEMELSQGSCFEVDPCWSEDLPPVRIIPAFPATLPGQPNPYWNGPYFQYKVVYNFGAIRVFDVRRDDAAGLAYTALNIVNVQRESSNASIVTGVVRNDSERVIRDARVVVYAPGECEWRETSLDSTVLNPGQKTEFRIESYCRGTTIAAVGQGIIGE